MAMSRTLTEDDELVDDGTAHLSKEFGVLNPQYPSSYWLIAWSKDVSSGEVLPLRRLERDLILWRDQGGTLRCQDHRCGQRLGRLEEQWSLKDGVIYCRSHPGNFSGTCRYHVVEAYGGIFVWNGANPAAPFPDVARVEGIQERDAHLVYWRVLLPFPAKWFAENLIDAGHFAYVHNMGDRGDTVVVDDQPDFFRDIMRFGGRRPSIVELYKRGDLSDIVGNLVGFAGEARGTNYGGGLGAFANVQSDEASGKAPQSGVRRVVGNYVDSTRLIFSWTPVDVDSHTMMVLAFMPKVRLPLVGPAMDWAFGRALVNRNWVGTSQDIAVMCQRAELPNPQYNRLDRALVRFRRFWDSRLLDRSLGDGDNVHANGRRAGIPWQPADVG